MYKMSKTLGAVLSLAFVLFMFTSCEKENGKDKATSITISSTGGLNVDLNSKKTFEIKDNNGDDVTSDSEIYVADTKISGNSHTFDKVGTFEVYAKYKDLTSNRLSINVQEETSGDTLNEFTPKVLVHDFTGTWCGFCASALYELNEKAEKHPGIVIPIEVHGNGSGNAIEGKESFDFPQIDKFSVEGFPTIWHNYDKNIEYFPSSEIEAYAAKKIKTGLAVNYNLDDEKVTVKIKSDEDIKGKKIVVLLLEGGLKSNQTNYDNDNPSSPAYQKGKVIEDFDYNNVAKASVTDNALGDVIADTAGKEHTLEFSVADKMAKIKDAKNTKVVAYLLDANDKYINAQVAVANENKGFE